MKIRLYDSLIGVLLLIGVGIPLIFGGTLDTWRTILTIAVILIVILYSATHKNRKTEINRFLYSYIVGFFVIVTYEIVKGSNLFDYSTYEIFYALRQYLWLMLAIPLYYVIIRGKDVDHILKKITRIVLCSLGLRTFTWFCQNYLGITIFYNLLYEYGTSWGRNGKQRIDATALISVLIPVLFYLYRKYKNKRYALALAFVFLYLILVSQTRTLILGSAICVISMLFFIKRSSSKKLIVQLSILAVFAIAMSMGGLDILLSKMHITANDGSIGYRQYEYAYYSSLLINGKWKTGLGIITSLNPNGNRLLFGNLDTQMYLDDLGIFECFLQFGLFSIFLYGMLLGYILYVMMKCHQAKEHEFAFYLMGQFFYIVIVSIPLNLFGIQRSFAVPVILAIVCAIHNTVMKKVKGK